MSISLLSVDPPTRHLKHLDWMSWQDVEFNLGLYTASKPASSIWEGERYHLYFLHTRFFRDVIDTLRTRLSVKNRAFVDLEAECIWIDGTPKAHWGGIAAGTHVELADLLVEVTVTSGATARRRALLFQAKYTDKYDDLGSGACQPGANDSTNLERDLLEVHSGPIKLYASGKKTTPIPAKGANTFDVSKDVTGQKLISHARYLLCPNDYNSLGTPYLSLTPYNRMAGQGFHEQYEEALFRLADASTNTVPDLQPGQQWTALVDAIGAWANKNAVTGKTVNRFDKQWKHRIVQLIVTPQTGSYFSHEDLRQFWLGRLPGSNGWHRKNGNALQREEPQRGFWYVRLNVTYA